MDLSKLINDYYENWKAGAAYLWRESSATVAPLIQANPDAYKGTVKDFLYALQGCERNLVRARAAIAKLPPGSISNDLAQKYAQCEANYKLVAPPFFADTQISNGPSMGFTTIMIIGALLIGLAGASLGVAAYEYTANLREQTALAAKELEARVSLAQQGLQLPPSTLPMPKDPFEEVGGAVSSIFKFGAIAAVTALGFKLFLTPPK